MIGAIIVLGGLGAIALWMEPHWASKDGKRFICRAQLLTGPSDPAGRWREVRGYIEDGRVVVRARSPLGGSLSGTWSMRSRGDIDRRKRYVYLLGRDSDDKQLALRIPDNSKARPTFDELLP